MDIQRLAKENEDLTIELRRQIHRHPELSRVEFKTLEYIKQNLASFGIDYIEVEDGGILGFIGDEKADKTVLLRADIDALPILENKKNLKREKAVVSENHGVQHACGHDAHTAILLTAGKILRENEAELPGRVVLLFERGEEGGGNLQELLKYIDGQKIKIDGAHAIHVNPSVGAGKIVARKGPVMAGGCGFSVVITGRDGHGARPDLANNPLDCFVAVYEALNSFRLKNISPYEPFTFSVGRLEGGTKENVITRSLSFGGSARFLNREAGERFAAEFQNILENVTKAYRCTYEIKGLFVGYPLVNSDAVTETAQKGVRKYLGAQALLTDVEPQMCSESFSRVARLYPSVLVGLGIANEELGSGADLHNEYFDIDERALYLGVAETVGFSAEFLNLPIDKQ